MKRYLIFGFDWYYPAGGMNDLVAMFDTLEEVIGYLTTGRVEGVYRYRFDHYEVFDTTTGDQVKFDEASISR